MVDKRLSLENSVEDTVNEMAMLFTFEEHLHLCRGLNWPDRVWVNIVFSYGKRTGSSVTVDFLKEQFDKYDNLYKLTNALIRHYDIQFNLATRRLHGCDSSWNLAELEMSDYQSEIKNLKARVFESYDLFVNVFSRINARIFECSPFLQIPKSRGFQYEFAMLTEYQVSGAFSQQQRNIGASQFSSINQHWSYEEEQCILFSEIERACEDIQLMLSRTQKVICDINTNWTSQFSSIYQHWSHEEEQCILFSEIERACEDIQLMLSRTQKIICDINTNWMNRLSVIEDKMKSMYSGMNARLDRVTEKLDKLTRLRNGKTTSTGTVIGDLKLS